MPQNEEDKQTPGWSQAVNVGMGFSFELKLNVAFWWNLGRGLERNYLAAFARDAAVVIPGSFVTTHHT